MLTWCTVQCAWYRIQCDCNVLCTSFDTTHWCSILQHSLREGWLQIHSFTYWVYRRKCLCINCRHTFTSKLMSCLNTTYGWRIVEWSLWNTHWFHNWVIWHFPFAYHELHPQSSFIIPLSEFLSITLLKNTLHDSVMFPSAASFYIKYLLDCKKGGYFMTTVICDRILENHPYGRAWNN